MAGDWVGPMNPAKDDGSASLPKVHFDFFYISEDNFSPDIFLKKSVKGYLLWINKLVGTRLNPIIVPFPKEKLSTPK